MLRLAYVWLTVAALGMTQTPARGQTFDSIERDPRTNRYPDVGSVESPALENSSERVLRDCNGNGIPDLCDISCGLPDEGCDFANCGRSSDCNRNGIPDDCDTAGPLPQEVDYDLHLGECEPCETDADCDDDVFCNGAEACTAIKYCVSGTAPCTARRLCDEDTNACMPDCNNNRISDDCDIDCESGCEVTTCGSSFDCNGNGLPDECELGLQAELSAFDAAKGDDYGESIAMDGDIAVVGAPGTLCDPGFNCGAAYVYRFSAGAPGGWIHEARLTVTDVYTVSLGRSVAVSGNRVVLGADGSYCFDNSPCHAAYVYNFDGTGWIEEARLTAPDGTYADQFGRTVAMSGDAIVVAGTENTLFVYRFRTVEPRGWVFETELTAPDVAEGILFGRSIAMSPDTIVVEILGNECTPSALCGAAYVYRFVPGSPGTWVEDAKLMVADPLPSAAQRFVDISGDVVVLGVRGGAVWVFRFDPDASPTWVEEARLFPSDRNEYHLPFGGRVAISGDTLVAAIGSQSCLSRDSSVTQTGCGEAAVYRHVPEAPKGWVEVARLTNPDETYEDGFADSITLSGDRALVAAPRANCPPEIYGCGAVYGFAIESVDCNENGVPDECDSLPGGDFDADGAIDLNDWRWLTACWTGPGDPLSPTPLGCAQTCRAAFDFDANGIVGLEDAADMLNLLTNRQPASPIDKQR